MIREILAQIQSLGVRLPDPRQARKGGAGPAEGDTLVIRGRAVTFPVASAAAERSPFSLQEGDPWMLMKDGLPLVEVAPVPRPRFYDGVSGDKIPFHQIALLHGSDCLASTVRQTCAHWNTKKRCTFCGIGLSLQSGRTIALKTPEQLAQAARAAVSLDFVRHVVLTTGDFPDWREGLQAMADAARAVKAASGLAVHVQVPPPPEPEALEILLRAGVDTLGIHVESLDPEVLAKAAPAKAALGRDRFVRAWKAGVELFGPNQVSSFLIAGLGEAPESLVEGAGFLASLGVFPLIVPLRPIPGSPMENVLPPLPETMIRVYASASRILARHGLASKNSKAGCVRCGACSALPAFEE